MTRSRWVLTAGGVLLALVAAALVAAQFALNSEAVARWVLEEVAARSDGVLRVERVSGTLNGGLRIGSVAADFGSGAAALETVEFKLDWRSLIARSIVLDYLDVERVQVEMREAESTSEQSQPIDFSMLVLIRDIRVDTATIAVNEAVHSIREAAGEFRMLRNRFELDSLSVTYDRATFTGSTAVTVTDELALEADICVDGEMVGEAVIGCLTAAGTLEAIRLDAELQAPFPATAVGVVELQESVFLDLALTWQNAGLSGFPDFDSARGTAQLTGGPQRLRVAADGALRYQSETAEFDGSVVIGTDTIDIEALRLDQPPASAEITGTAARDLTSARLGVTLHGVDPQRWLSQWPGDLDLSAEVSLAVQPAFSVAASDIVVSGQLREHPLAATGAVVYSDAEVTIDQLRVVSRSDQVLVSGHIAETLDIDVEASIADVAVAVPGASGSLSAEVEILGSMQQPRVRGVLGLADLSAEGFSARAVQISGVAGFAAEDPVELAVSATDIDVSGTAVEESIISVAGTGAAHRLEAQVQAADWNASLASNGEFVERAWQGTVDRFEFAPGELGLWRLMQPAEVRYGSGAYSVRDLCLSYTLSRVCAGVSVAGSSEDSLQVEAVNFDVGILEPFLPTDIRAKGLVNARGELANFIADPRGEVAIDAADAQVDVALADEVFFPVPVEQLSLGAVFNDAGATLSMSLNAAELGNATAALAVLGNPREPASALEGTLNLEWRDAGTLALLSPDVEDVLGQISAEMTLGGTVAEPVIGGTAQWSDGSVTVPEWALVVDGIVASIRSNGDSEALFEATGNVDGTPVGIDGTVLLDPEQGWPMQLRLRGENLSLVQMAGIEVVVTPELEADVRLPRIAVGGSVKVPTAHFRDVTLPQQAVVPSSDAVIHGRTTEERARPIDLVADFTLELGDDVTYRDANLTASVTGRLDLDYRSGDGATAQGQLTVSGEYNAYGTPLALQRGQLIFVGPMDDPSLDIRAVREFDTVTVGAQLNGTLQQPVTTLFSEPPMTEAETLSWLLLGQPLDVAREAESNALQSAALSMGLQQAFPVIERIGESLGLDDFAIRTSETDVSALMAGKYLSPNLYFRYSYGLFNRIGGVLLRYRINDRFSLETRSGEHSSMDLLYTVERD